MYKPFQRLNVMRINKDLTDALLMIACICLVLISTTNYSEPYTKTCLIAVTGFVAFVCGILRYVVAPRQKRR